MATTSSSALPSTEFVTTASVSLHTSLLLTAALPAADPIALLPAYIDFASTSNEPPEYEPAAPAESIPETSAQLVESSTPSRRARRNKRQLRPKLKQCFYLKLLGPEGLERFLKDTLELESFEVIGLENNKTLLYRINDRQCEPNCQEILRDIRRRGCIQLPELFRLMCALYLEGKIEKGEYLIEIFWET